MKTTFTLISILFIILTSIAQNGINYKALIKGANGNALVSSPISIQFIIYEGDALTNNVYQESHTINTDANGFVILNIGEGITSDDFNTINWSSDEHYLNVRVNIGSGLVDLGTTAFTTVPYAKVAENVSGLEAIDEGNGVGWRLVGKNPNNYGLIGRNAIDLSEAEVTSATLGATESFSSAFGVNTTASGYASTAFGVGSVASGDLSTAMGSGATASGNYSIAFGSNSSASGNYSTVFGLSSEASGNFSTAIGRGIITSNHSTAIGRYNNGGGNATEWLDSDPLFEIGNGTSDSNRSNALTIFKNGEHIINSDFVGLNINAQNAGIFISNSLTGILINNPEQIGIGVTSAGASGGSFTGVTTGVFAQSSTPTNPDIILGGENGIISSSTAYTSGDISLRSNNDIIMEIDNDNVDTGAFIIRWGGSSTNIFTVNGDGNVIMGDRLQIGNEIIEDGGSDILAFSSSLVPTVDEGDRLGGPNRKWLDVWASDGTINTSDRRSKENISNLNYGLTEVLQMQPVSYTWKNRKNQDIKLGLIAQDLLKITPEVVKTHIWEKDETSGVFIKQELNRMGVYYSDLIPVLIKAIQEQQKIIESQGDALIASKSNYEALLSRIEILESKSSN